MEAAAQGPPEGADSPDDPERRRDASVGPFSVVIPTIWRSPRTVPLLEELDRSPLVGQIILVDNQAKDRPPVPPLSTLTILQPPRNVYVNPAWNLGVRIASRPLLCISNDDVTFDVDELLGFVWANRARLGSFGVHPSSFDTPLHERPPSLERGMHIRQRWACVLFMKTRDYPPIPEDLRIWYGDNWVAARARPAYSIRTSVATEPSTSVTAPQFKRVLERDKVMWRKKYHWRTKLRDPGGTLRRLVARLRGEGVTAPPS